MSKNDEAAQDLYLVADRADTLAASYGILKADHPEYFQGDTSEVSLMNQITNLLPKLAVLLRNHGDSLRTSELEPGQGVLPLEGVPTDE